MIRLRKTTGLLFFIKSDQLSDVVCSEEFPNPCSGKKDELKPGLQERMRVSVLSTSIATEHKELNPMSKNEVKMHV